MSKAIGIDLGSTNSVASIKKVYTEIIYNQEGDALTSSCVTQQRRKFIVGKSALEWRKQDPENTITSIKRIMGRNFIDEEVQKIIQKVTYQISPFSKGSKK